VVPSKEKGGAFKTLDEYVEHSISRENFGKIELLSDKKIRFNKTKVREISLSSQYKMPPRAIDQVLVTRIKKWIVFEHNGYFYDLKYGAGEEDYSKYIKAYKRAKKSFKFQAAKEVQ
jgi:hypothetical protein